MTYGSICSGIEAATVAWRPLGWRAAWFAEIDPFASAVLAHHYPEVPNFGDFTKIMPGAAGAVDVLVGGTPCQSFSIAGQRAGLDDPRGNLTLEYLRLAARLRPRWLVWENVPGVLSIDGGRTFSSIVGTLVDLGYGLSYRVLDAQFFGVPQRRRRVFVVAHLGDWQAAAAVLFERESLRRDLAPRRKTAPRIARAAEVGPSGGRFTDVAPTLDARCKDGPIRNQVGLLAFGGNNTSGPIDVATACNAHGGAGRIDFETETFCLEMAAGESDESLIAHTLLGKANCSHDSTLETYVAHTLRGEGMDASEDGTGRGTPLVPVVATTLTPIAFSSKDYGADAMEDVAPTLRAMGHDESHPNAGGQIAVITPTVIFESTVWNGERFVAWEKWLATAPIQCGELPDDAGLPATARCVAGVCGGARVRLLRDGDPWLMYVGDRRAGNRRRDFASPFLQHAIRTAERWYGAPANGWHAEERRDENEHGD